MYMMKVASPKHYARWRSCTEVQNDVGTGKKKELKRSGRKFLMAVIIMAKQKS